MLSIVTTLPQSSKGGANMYNGLFDGAKCYTAPDVANESMIITGQSGQGKSVRINFAELEAIHSNNTIVVLDISKTHQPEFLLDSIRDEYSKNVNRINIATDGIDLNILTPLTSPNGKTESEFRLISSAVSMLSAGIRIGDRQEVALKDTVEEAIKIKNACNCSDSIALITAFNANPKDIKRKEVYQKLWRVLEANIFRNSTRKIEANKINILDFSDLEPQTAEIIGEIVLSFFWRQIFSIGIPIEFGQLTCVIDEMQHFKLTKKSTLRAMLTESRRFGLNVILATQTTAIFEKSETAILMQAATRLLFRPADSDLDNVAHLIDPKNKISWRNKLTSLKIGECIALGKKIVNGKYYDRPLLLK